MAGVGTFSVCWNGWVLSKHLEYLPIPTGWTHPPQVYVSVLLFLFTQRSQSWGESGKRGMRICHLGALLSSRDQRYENSISSCKISRMLTANSFLLFTTFSHFPCHAFQRRLLPTLLTLAKFSFDITTSVLSLYISTLEHCTCDNAGHSCSIIFGIL